MRMKIQALTTPKTLHNLQLGKNKPDLLMIKVVQFQVFHKDKTLL